MEKDLAELTKLADTVKENREAVTELVRSLRREGASWADIGGALRQSRQAAWRKYRHVDGSTLSA